MDESKLREARSKLIASLEKQADAMASKESPFPEEIDNIRWMLDSIQQLDELLAKRG